MVFRAKLRQNAENTCALLTMANNGLAATLTNDQGKLHSVLSRVEPGGEIKVIFMVSIRIIIFFQFGAGIRIAQLSLKHRMNKHHKQRIILFICSPIDDEQKDIIKIAKKLKKEKVNIGTVHSQPGRDIQRLLSFSWSVVRPGRLFQKIRRFGRWIPA